MQMPPGVTRTLKLSALSGRVRDCQQIPYYQRQEEGGGSYGAEPPCPAEQRPSLKGKEQRQSKRNVLRSELCPECFTFHCSGTKRSGCVCRRWECSPCPGDSHQHRSTAEFLFVFNIQLPLSQRNFIPKRFTHPESFMPKGS